MCHTCSHLPPWWCWHGTACDPWRQWLAPVIRCTYVRHVLTPRNLNTDWWGPLEHYHWGGRGFNTLVMFVCFLLTFLAATVFPSTVSQPMQIKNSRKHKLSCNLYSPCFRLGHTLCAGTSGTPSLSHILWRFPYFHWCQLPNQQCRCSEALPAQRRLLTVLNVFKKASTLSAIKFRLLFFHKI